jgi:GST-like protein
MSMTEAVYQLYENPGWGSAIVEMQLDWYGLPYRRMPAGGNESEAAVKAAMTGVNPMFQVPALILPSGEVMTETAAMTLYLADMAGNDTLVPGPGAAERAAFLRWLIFLVAAVYPSFVYGDVPTRFVPAAGADAFQGRMIDHRKAMWLVMEAEAKSRGGPWFLGARMSAIDIYLACMVHWRPKKAWFQAAAPTLYAIAEATARLPQLGPAMIRNFG